MNIFVLDTNPNKAAGLQVPKSGTKMVLETAQLLSGALRLAGYDGDDLYKLSHKNHPSSIWTRRSRANFLWLCEHGLALAELYTQRSNKIHKSQAIIERAIELSDLIDDTQDKVYWTVQDLAIKSTDEGLSALESFQQSSQAASDVVIAYSKFYFAKTYVQTYFEKCYD